MTTRTLLALSLPLAVWLTPGDAGAQVVADSFTDWSATGTQGEKGWLYGYYNLTLDADGMYSVIDLLPFLRDGTNTVSPTNHWNGTMWDLSTTPNSGPWTELGRENTHPNGVNSAPNHEHWTIRRWMSTIAGEATVVWRMRKQNTGGGNGVAGHLFVNGAEADAATIAFNDGIGIQRQVVVTLAIGDMVDLALSPNGSDGADGSFNRLMVVEGNPDADGDDVVDPYDNCLDAPNPSQADRNRNGIGDACDDPDADGVVDALDNCPDLANPSQANGDGDGRGDACDNCPEVDNPGQEDRDRDGIGNACDGGIADSIDDWSATGMQGEKGWLYGYYNLTFDADMTYQATDFLPFLNDGTNTISPNNHWNGTLWELNPAATGPWTELAREGTHPNGTNSLPPDPVQEHWTIRRWMSDHDGDVAITWHTRKTNTGGSGTTGRLFIDGVQVDSATIPGPDNTGVIRTYYASIQSGTLIDLVLTPEGVGDREDGADGSANWMRIKTLVPCGASNAGEKIADSQADWSASGTQGEKNWSYGYHNVRRDVETGNGTYDPSDLILFLNDGSNTVSVDPAIGNWRMSPNHWNGSQWDLLNNSAAGANHGPWTEVNRAGGHPAANAQGDPEVHWAVRRWKSSGDGTVRITGAIRNSSANGDGVIGRVLHNGAQVYAALSDGFYVNFSVDIDVRMDDLLDFAIDPDGAGVLDPGTPATVNQINDGNDGTTFTVQIHRTEVFRCCEEMPETVALTGPQAIIKGEPATIRAEVSGLDPGATAQCAFTVVSGAATLTDNGDCTAAVTCGGEGDVVVRVLAGDGVCADAAAAEITLRCACPEAGDTRCKSLTIVRSPEGGIPGLYGFLAEGEDGSGDPITYTFTADDGSGGEPELRETGVASPGPLRLDWELTEGTWRVCVAVDDDPDCPDAAQDNQCCIDVTVNPPGRKRLANDCNRDSSVDISDPVCLLDHLFLGGNLDVDCGEQGVPAPTSLPAIQLLLDANQDGSIDITDPVVVLGHLFLGGPVPDNGGTLACILIAGCDSDACPNP